MDGLNKFRMPRVFFELLPKPSDMDVDCACRGHGVIAPDGVEQDVARMDDSAVLDQELEELEFHCRKVDGFVFARDLGAPEIDRDAAKTHGTGFLIAIRVRGRASEQCFYPRKKLDHLERLCQIIV